MRQYLKTSGVILLLFIFLSSFDGLMYSSVPPQGYTGADGSSCVTCHSTNPLNSAGGAVAAIGLPTAGYTAGTTYNFSITTTHSATDRKRWGFSIVARNSLNQTVGNFSDNNANAANNGAELSHLNAVATPNSASSYTYQNLAWTAPANPTANDQLITFYFVGNAANGAGTGGDFIYAGTATSSLVAATQTYTFTGNGNWSNPANWTNNAVPPAILTGNAIVIIDPLVDGECVLDVVQRIGATVPFTVKDGKQFRIVGDLIINNQ